MESICDKFSDDIIKDVGKGEFKIGFNLTQEKAEIYAVLYVDKNSPMYNSLFRDAFFS